MQRELGVLAADHRSCVFSDGTTVTFHTDLDLAGDGPIDIDVTVERDGSACSLSTVDGLTLAVDERAARLDTSSAGGTLSCPDGTTYGTDDPLWMLACDNLYDVPRVMWSWGPHAVAFGAGDHLEGFWVDCWQE